MFEDVIIDQNPQAWLKWLICLIKESKIMWDFPMKPFYFILWSNMTFGLKTTVCAKDKFSRFSTMARGRLRRLGSRESRSFQQ